MSRLDSFIRRMTAQRDILNHLAADLALPSDGAMLEIGLGNGRTYSHLGHLFPRRRIIAFDRAMHAHPDSVPPEADLILGEIAVTAPALVGQAAALVHVDIGTGNAGLDAQTLTWLPQLVAELLGPQGIAVSGLALDLPELTPLPLPAGIEPGRYFLYRRGG